MTAVRYDFSEHLARANKDANDPVWLEVYGKAFPDFRQRIVVTDQGLQHKGIDTVIVLKGGGKLNVDEKLREVKDKAGRTLTPQASGILLEEWSDVAARKPGWWRADKKQTDLIAYAFKATQECFVIPFQSLRRTRVDYGALWLEKAHMGIEGFREIHSKSKSSDGSSLWETFSIAVPVPVLQVALNNVLRVTWGEEVAVRRDFARRTCVWPRLGGVCGLPIADDASARICEGHQQNA